MVVRSLRHPGPARQIGSAIAREMCGSSVARPRTTATSRAPRPMTGGGTTPIGLLDVTRADQLRLTMHLTVSCRAGSLTDVAVSDRVTVDPTAAELRTFTLTVIRNVPWAASTGVA